MTAKVSRSNRYTLPAVLEELVGSSPMKVVLQGTLETSCGRTTTLARTEVISESLHSPNQATCATDQPSGRLNSRSVEENPVPGRGEGLVSLYGLFRGSVIKFLAQIINSILTFPSILSQEIGTCKTLQIKRW